MAPRSDHSQSPVRSAQGEVVSNREFQLCNLRRITSAREPLSVEQDHRKIAPMRRKLRKNHHLFNSERMGVTVPRQLMRNYVNTEEKPPSAHQADRPCSRQSKLSSVEPDMYDLGPTEVLYSSPFEMSSSVYSSQCTTIPSCSSVPSSMASSAVTRFTSSTLKYSPESETSTVQMRGDASPDPSCPSVALRKCFDEDFENLDDIMKLSPREQALLPRSVYLAAQLAATPNVNYSAKYGFRPLSSTRWESPRSISANFMSNPDTTVAKELPSYFKEASHPLRDLKYIAKPWWVSLFKGGERRGKRKLRNITIKRELFADSVDCIFDSASNVLASVPNEERVEEKDINSNSVRGSREHVRTPSKDHIYSLLLQKINDKRKMTLKAMNGKTVVEVNSRATQTYITHPSYAHNHVEFWNEHTDNNKPTITLKEAIGKQKKSVASVATSCSLQSLPISFQSVSRPESGLLQANPAPFTIQNFAAPGTKLPGFGYFNPPTGCNVGHPFPFVPMPPLKFASNQNIRWNVAPIRMPVMNGTGDSTQKIFSNNVSFPKVFIPVTYMGDPTNKMVPSICEVRPFTNNQVVFISQPGISHTPCLVQPMGVPLS